MRDWVTATDQAVADLPPREKIRSYSQWTSAELYVDLARVGQGLLPDDQLLRLLGVATEMHRQEKNTGIYTSWAGIFDGYSANEIVELQARLGAVDHSLLKSIRPDGLAAVAEALHERGDYAEAMRIYATAKARAEECPADGGPGGRGGMPGIRSLACGHLYRVVVARCAVRLDRLDEAVALIHQMDGPYPKWEGYQVVARTLAKCRSSDVAREWARSIAEPRLRTAAFLGILDALLRGQSLERVDLPTLWIGC